MGVIVEVWGMGVVSRLLVVVLFGVPEMSFKKLGNNYVYRH